MNNDYTSWIVQLGDTPSLMRTCIGDIDGNLYDAILMNNVDKTNRLLETDVSVNARDSVGVPILQKAIEWDADLSIIQSLLKAGAVVDEQTPRLETALHLAIAKKRVEVVECLLNAGASVDIKLYTDRTALQIAALRGSFPIAECLLFNRPIDINSEDVKKALNIFLELSCVEKIMQAAIEEGCPNLLKLLFQHHPEFYLQLNEQYIKKLSASVGAIAEKLEGKTLTDRSSKQMMRCLHLLYLMDIEGVLSASLSQFPELTKELDAYREQIAQDNGFFKSSTNEAIDIVKIRDWTLRSPLHDEPLTEESCTDIKPGIRPGY